jgi:hypothetical protein
MTKYKYGSPNMEKEESRSKNGKKMRQFIVPFCSIMHRITITMTIYIYIFGMAKNISILVFGSVIL